MTEPVSPIDDRHRALGAKMVPFGGWTMPLSYPGGTLDEHRRCRTDAVVFDVSHLGTVRVSGPAAFDQLQRSFTNDLRRIGPGRAQYTHLLDDDGFVLDDIIIWWVDDDRFDVMPNASNTDRVDRSLGTDREGFEAPNVTSERAILAVQGPHARAKLATVSAEAAAVERFGVHQIAWNGVPLVVAGTGYTGEDGVELAVPAEAAGPLWDALLAADIGAAGLGARDTLRLEAGLPLHGNELGPGITPLQAGLGWVVRWDKGDFTGKPALEAEREAGVARLLRGLRVDGRRPPRHGQQVKRGDQVIGEVTSGNFSPMLECGIAMAFLPPDVSDGDVLSIDVRGELVAATVVAMPFHTS